MDGVDAVLVEISGARCRTLGGLTHPYPEQLRMRLHVAITPDTRLSLHDIASLDIEVGEWFALTAAMLLEHCQTRSDQVLAVGSHGQTLRHAPRAEYPYSIQIGSPAVIAARLGITTVGDFRSMDIAYGGEGAPLVPAFHQWLLRHRQENRIVANIGGISNISLLPALTNTAIQGYDTGPGNCLLDSWCARHCDTPYDEDGRWAASGTLHRTLLEALLQNPYFVAPPPKSTGREVFNLAYLDAFLAQPDFASVSPADVQATLAALTIETLAREVERMGNGWAGRLLVCGGGAHNSHLMQGLSQRLVPMAVSSTSLVGVDPDLVEACAFAWLAFMRLQRRPVQVTTSGEARAVTLGAVYAATPLHGK